MWLVVYIVNAASSVIDVSLALQPVLWSQPGDLHRIAESLLNFALSHGILFLGSVVHHVPTAAPHSWLLRYMRAVLLFYTINSWVNVELELNSLRRLAPNTTKLK